MLLKITDSLSINPSLVASLEFDRTNYMNCGGTTDLVITMASGAKHRVSHGYGVSVYEVERAIKEALVGPL